MNKELLSSVYSYLESKEEEMVSVLEDVVRLHSFSTDIDYVKICINRFKELFELEGFKCELIDTSPNAPTLVGIYGEDRPGKPVLFSGHIDTVIAKGEYENIFRREGNKAYGPGVLDSGGYKTVEVFFGKRICSSDSYTCICLYCKGICSHGSYTIYWDIKNTKREGL